MTIRGWDQVERLVANRVPESPSLEFKRELPVTRQPGRLEELKDLTGMGNGGGGTLVYGVEEEDEVAVAITPLRDRADVGRLEDAARSAVRPPLLWEPRVIDEVGGNGFAIVADVSRSPLGPYMIEGYSENRFYVRIGTSVVQMDETQVRDAYGLAARGREGRPELWAEHGLPMKPPTQDQPWLVTSGLPETPLTDLFNPKFKPATEFTPPDRMRLHSDFAELKTALARPRVWANGVFGESKDDGALPAAMARIHRDGWTAPDPLTGTGEGITTLT